MEQCSLCSQLRPRPQGYQWDSSPPFEGSQSHCCSKTRSVKGLEPGEVRLPQSSKYLGRSALQHPSLYLQHAINFLGSLAKLTVLHFHSRTNLFTYESLKHCSVWKSPHSVLDDDESCSDSSSAAGHTHQVGREKLLLTFGESGSLEKNMSDNLIKNMVLEHLVHESLPDVCLAKWSVCRTFDL